MTNKYLQDWLDIIENMSNENTYKLAWGRAILEVINEKDITNEKVIIKFDELSPKIVKYYWNQSYFFNLVQGPNKKPKVVNEVEKLIDKYKHETGSNIPVWYEKAESFFIEQNRFYDKFLSHISSILKIDVAWRFKRINKKDVDIYDVNLEKRELVFTSYQASILKDNIFILSQLLNYRWAQLLEQFNTSPKVTLKVKNISDNKLRRNNLTKFKNILLEANNGKAIDFYTGKALEDNDISVDHVIPWSFMYSDDIWNLVLTTKSNNSSKSNTVPTKETINRLKERNNHLIDKLRDNKTYQLKLQEAIDNNYVDKFYYSFKTK